MKLIILLALCAAPAFARRLPFVVGGQDVNPVGKWPWQASLQVGSFGTFSHTCGGSLITNNHVITAAHCVSRPTTSYIVVLGMHDRIPPRQDGDPKEYQLTSYVRHPDWVRDGTLGFPNDVAVIRLASAADVSSQFIAPATLSPADNADGSAPEYVGENCFISGWGRLYGFGPLPDILQEANIDVLTEAECTNAWGSRIQRYHICLQDRANQERGACNGDSGGPLVCQVSGNWVLAGVTSWGRTGCITTSPSVYARVSYFRQWIDQQTASL